METNLERIARQLFASRRDSVPRWIRHLIEELQAEVSKSTKSEETLPPVADAATQLDLFHERNTL